jgi:hypothetical protein
LQFDVGVALLGPDTLVVIIDGDTEDFLGRMLAYDVFI